MYGVGMGKFKVYQRINGDERSRWTISGNQSPEWKRGSLEVFSTEPYQVSICSLNAYSS